MMPLSLNKNNIQLKQRSVKPLVENVAKELEKELLYSIDNGKHIIYSYEGNDFNSVIMKFVPVRMTFSENRIDLYGREDQMISIRPTKFEYIEMDELYMICTRYGVVGISISKFQN